MRRCAVPGRAWDARPVPGTVFRTGAPPLGWLARGVAEVPGGEGWLTRAEAARATAQRFTKRRAEYLLRRLAGKQAVALSTGLPADLAGMSRIEIANEPSGAPFALVDG